MPLIKRLTANSKGNDFVVGDLHGCRYLLDILLDTAGFDPTHDRLFSTGDLVDRGPDSPECLSLLQEPWFHPVLGNHELMLIHYLEARKQNLASDDTYDALELLLYNGGDWIEDTLYDCLEQIPHLLERLKSLPLILSVGDASTPDRFHVTHGDLLFDRATVISDTLIDGLVEGYESLERPHGLAVFNGMTPEEAITHGVWSRRLISHPGVYQDIPIATGLSRVYAGHTITTTPMRRASHLFIDGGGFLCGRRSTPEGPYGLNLVDHHHGIRYWTNGVDISASELPGETDSV